MDGDYTTTELSDGVILTGSSLIVSALHNGDVIVEDDTAERIARLVNDPVQLAHDIMTSSAESEDVFVLV